MDLSALIGKLRNLLPLLLLCTVITGLVMFAVVNIVPYWKTYQDLQAQADAGNQAIAAQAAGIDPSADIAILRHRIDSNQTDLVSNTDIFMDAAQADSILQKFYAYAKDSSVEIANLQTQHNVDAASLSDPNARLNQASSSTGQTPADNSSAIYSVQAMRVTANGTVANLIRFMTQIREIGVAGLSVNNLAIKNNDDGTASLMMDVLVYISSLSDGKAYENLEAVVIPTPVTVAIQPTPTPITPTPIVEASGSAEATAQATAAPAGNSVGSVTVISKDTIPPEPLMYPVYTDNFDTGNLNHWKLGAGWILFGDKGAKSLQTTDNSGDVTFAYDTLDNSAVQVRVMMSSNNVKLTLRQSSAGAYAVVLQPTGQVALYRGSTLVKSTTTDQSSIGRWRVLRLSVVDGIIRVAVDGVELLTARDASELPPGTFTFSAVGRGIVRVDDVQVWSLDTDTPY